MGGMSGGGFRLSVIPGCPLLDMNALAAGTSMTEQKNRHPAAPNRGSSALAGPNAIRWSDLRLKISEETAEGIRSLRTDMDELRVSFDDLKKDLARALSARSLA